MSDFKLGIVRLGRVAGKVSWIPGLPCAAGGGGKGPLGTTKRRWKNRFRGDESVLVNLFNHYQAFADAGVAEIDRF